jgi:hypothetical protein
MNSIPLIESIIEKHHREIDAQFIAYRNHVYRVYYMAIAYLNKPSQEDQEKLAITAAFHDIGIWTHQTFDYLKPSIFLVREYLDSHERPEWKEEISLIIDMHHKLNGYHGTSEDLVEAFRKADWMDLSFGYIGFGLKSRLQELQGSFPTKGFHWFLIKQSFKNLVKNPLNPLPMFKI